MREWFQILLTSTVILLMMFAMAAILDNPDNNSARKEFIAWALVAAMLIGQAIW